MPTYTMFKRDGTPLRATASVSGWEFEVTEQPPGSRPSSGRSVVHEITHVQQNQNARHHTSQHNQSDLEFLVSRAERLGKERGSFYLPEVDDEVLVMFASGNGLFGGFELTPKGSRQGSGYGFGRVNRATFCLKIKRKGRDSLSLNILAAGDAKFERDRRVLNVF